MTVRPNSPPQIDQRAVEQAALLQIGEQRRRGGVDLGGARRQPRFEVLVMIPAAGPDLDEADAALDEPARDQQLPALRRVAVQRADALRLLRQIERVGRFDLHPVGHLERLDARLELRVLLQLLAVHRVQLLHQIELAPLLVAAEVLVADVRNHPVDRRRRRVDARPCRSPGRNAEPQLSAPPGGSPPFGRSEM